MTRKIISALFVIALTISVAGGLLLVAAQLVGIAAGAAPFTEMLDTSVKPWIVGTSAVCALASFVLMYMRGDGREHG